MKSTKHRYSSKILAVIMVLIMIVGCLSVSAFAYTDNSTNGVDFELFPLPYFNGLTWSEIYDEGFLVKQYSSGKRDVAYTTTSNANVYIFAYSSTPYVVYVSDTQDAQCTLAYVDGTDNTPSYLLDFTTNNLHSSTQLYYKTQSSGYGLAYSASTIPTFSTFADGMNAVRDWIDNPPVVGPGPQPLNITLPAGNAIYIDITGLSPSASLSTSTPNRYYSSPHNGNQTLTYTDTIVSVGSNIPGNSINWQGTGSTDLLGRYRSWSSTLIVQPNKKYIAIFNPCSTSMSLEL